MVKNATDKVLDSLMDENDTLRLLLRRILDWALAERNTPEERVRHHYYGRDQETGLRECPECLLETKRMLAETTKYFSPVPDKEE